MSVTVIEIRDVNEGLERISREKESLESKIASSGEYILTDEEKNRLRDLEIREGIIERVISYNEEVNDNSISVDEKEELISSIVSPILNYVSIEANRIESRLGSLTNEDANPIIEKAKEYFVLSFSSINPEYLEDYLFGMKSYGKLESWVERNRYSLYIMDTALERAIGEVTNINLEKVVDGFRRVYGFLGELEEGTFRHINELTSFYREESELVEKVHKRKLWEIKRIIEIQEHISQNWKEIQEDDLDIVKESEVKKVESQEDIDWREMLLFDLKRFNTPAVYEFTTTNIEDRGYHYQSRLVSVEEEIIDFLPFTVYVLNSEEKLVIKEPVGKAKEKKYLLHEVPIIERDNVVDLLELAKTYGRAVDKVVEVYSSRR